MTKNPSPGFFIFPFSVFFFFLGVGLGGEEQDMVAGQGEGRCWQ